MIFLLDLYQNLHFKSIKWAYCNIVQSTTWIKFVTCSKPLYGSNRFLDVSGLMFGLRSSNLFYLIDLFVSARWIICEDDRSLRKHVQCMQDKMKKRQPNTSRIADKMKRTSEYRQRFCREKTTAEVLQEFPCLRITGFVSIIILNKFCCYFPNTRKIIICLLLWCSVLTRLIVCVSCKSKLTNRWLALHDALS